MADILIKGMEMPTNEPLIVKINPDGSVSKLWRDVFLEYANCKAIPVPPHGDLIDRDEMKKTIKPWSPEDERTGCTFDTVKKLMHTMLNRAPTIIEAEGET